MEEMFPASEEVFKVVEMQRPSANSKQDIRRSQKRERASKSNRRKEEKEEKAEQTETVDSKTQVAVEMVDEEKAELQTNIISTDTCESTTSKVLQSGPAKAEETSPGDKHPAPSPPKPPAKTWGKINENIAPKVNTPKSKNVNKTFLNPDKKSKINQFTQITMSFCQISWFFFYFLILFSTRKWISRKSWPQPNTETNPAFRSRKKENR